MNNNMNIIIPPVAQKAFPVLSDAVYIRRFASLIPLSPDTIFDIFMTKSGHFFTFVTTDHADPHDQSRELRNISGRYEFEFVDLIKPYANSETIKVLEHDDMEGDFLVKDKTNYYYYYIANTRQNTA